MTHELQQTYVICPVHGKHPHVIESNIDGYNGVWCMKCALDMLGNPLPSEPGPIVMQDNKEVYD